MFLLVLPEAFLQQTILHMTRAREKRRVRAHNQLVTPSGIGNLGAKVGYIAGAEDKTLGTMARDYATNLALTTVPSPLFFLPVIP